MLIYLYSECSADNKFYIVSTASNAPRPETCRGQNEKLMSLRKFQAMELVTMVT